jgi:hypothetical protein
MLTTKLVCLGTSVCVVAALAQAGSAQTSTGSVAYVYVSNTIANSSTNEVQAYAADASGKLTPLTGSPFQENVGSIAVNGEFLMGVSLSTPDINAYRIGANGSLTFKVASNYVQYNPNGCGGAADLIFGHTGSDLYVPEYNYDCANSGLASFVVDKPTGALDYLGVDNTGVDPGVTKAPSFIGDKGYAYLAGNDTCFYYTIYGFKRKGNGLLISSNSSYNLPAPPPQFTRYIPDLAAADPTNHVAFVMFPGMPPGCTSDPLQMASYTADASGNLVTTNTYSNMPATQIVSPYDLKMAPSGKLLAIAGQEGLQAFHFNGANPITAYTGLLTTDPISQMFWDDSNHLYAISQSAGMLRVFTITPTTYKEAAGSPYAINSPDAIIVQPLPLP